MNQKLKSLTETIYPLLAIISTGSLLFIGLTLYPIAKWAINQNDCIERTFRIDGKNNAGTPAKVWSCNGGGE